MLWRYDWRVAYMNSKAALERVHSGIREETPMELEASPLNRNGHCGKKAPFMPSRTNEIVNTLSVQASGRLSLKLRKQQAGCQNLPS